MDFFKKSPEIFHEVEIAVNDVVEETYTDFTENLLKNWLVLSKEKTIAHNIKGKRLKKLHEYVGLPAILLPVAFTPVSGLFSEEEWMRYANVIVLAVTGILSGTHAFFDYSRKSQLHFQYEAQYADVSSTIMVELTKERSIRIRADRFIEMIQSKIDNLGANEPLL